MDNIKYTNDGRKVKVIGQLNSKQIIVREIFIDGDTEIPTGEDFIVTSLLDKPLMTWKEKQLTEIEESYDKRKSEYTIKTRTLKNEYSNLLTKLGEKNKFIRNYIKSENTMKVFNFVNDILTGKIKYMVNDWFYKIKILEYDEFIASYGGIKLLTLLGSDNGNLEIKINQYSDGSGGNDTYHFFKTKEEAFNYIKNRIESIDKANVLTQEIVEKSKEYGANINIELLNEWKKNKLSSIEKQKQQCEKSIQDYKKQEEMINNI